MRRSPAQLWCPCHAFQQHTAAKSNVHHSRTFELQGDKYYCRVCIQLSLEGTFALHESALTEHDQRRAWCADQINRIRRESALSHHNSTFDSSNASQESPSPLQQLSEDQDTLTQLRSRLSNLQSQCNSMAMELATLSYRNEERAYTVNQQRDVVTSAHDGLGKLFQSILSSNPDIIFSKKDDILLNESGLSHVIQQSIQQARKNRFKLALQVFHMFNIDMGAEYVHLNSLSALHRQEMEQGHKLDDALISTMDSNPIEDLKRQDRLLQKRIAHGIGKISGLPLPHAGPALYGIMPAGVLTSSLRLVASLTTLLAKCLGISLPHPILLHPPRDPSYVMKEQGDIIHDSLEESPEKRPLDDLVTWKDVYSLGHEDTRKVHENMEDKDTSFNINGMTKKRLPTHTSSFSNTASSTFQAISSSSSSFISMMKASSNKITRSAHKVIDKMTGHTYGDKSVHHENSGKNHHPVVVPTMDNESVQQRLNYAVSAKVCEGYHQPMRGNTGKHHHGAIFDLKPPLNSLSSRVDSREETLKNEENFIVALELLQNNIVGLCVHSGVPVSTLWPAEAILLNLYSLLLFCREQTESKG